MKCRYCDKPTERNGNYCPHCGRKKKIVTPSIVAGLLLTALLFFALFYLVPIPKELTSFKEKMNPSETVLKLENESEKVDIVDIVQQTVFTVYTPESQGSAFLYDEEGSVITNAHVVEGSLTALIKTADGSEYTGSVIGYSNEIDIALIFVPELSGLTPFPLEKEDASKVGEEVIALGTPLGFENTATFGFLTGINRTFNIPPHTFTNVYQISAPIEPGNSGGPLVSIDREKIIAINSAKSIEAENIAFSIPLHQVVSLVDDWIKSPLSEAEITAMFFDEDGNYYYDFLWTLFDEYYFDDGHFTDDEDHHNYWLYDDDLDSWEQYDDDNSYYDWEEYENSYDEWDSDYWDESEEDEWLDGYWDDEDEFDEDYPDYENYDDDFDDYELEESDNLYEWNDDFYEYDNFNLEEEFYNEYV